MCESAEAFNSKGPKMHAMHVYIYECFSCTAYLCVREGCVSIVFVSQDVSTAQLFQVT